NPSGYAQEGALRQSLDDRRYRGNVRRRGRGASRGIVRASGAAAIHLRACLASARPAALGQSVRAPCPHRFQRGRAPSHAPPDHSWRAAVLRKTQALTPMGMRSRTTDRHVGAVAAMLAVLAAPALAQGPGDFFKDRHVDLYIGYSVG